MNKRNTFGKSCISICICMILVVLISSCVEKSIPESSPQPSPTSRTYQTVFKVSGTAQKAFVTWGGPYSGEGTFHGEEVITVPWEKSIVYKHDPGMSIILTVHLRADSPGTLTCEIWIDDRLKDAETISTGFTSCIWKLP